MQQLIECVPNFSEGQNMEIISMITYEIESIEQAEEAQQLLNQIRTHLDALKQSSPTP